MSEKKDDEKGGFLDKVKNFIHDVGEKFEEVVGFIPNAETIRAHGLETIKVPLTLIYDDIKSTYKDEPGSILPYKVKVELIVDIPVMGRVMIPVEIEGEISVPYKPEVDLQKEKMDRFSFKEKLEPLCFR